VSNGTLYNAVDISGFLGSASPTKAAVNLYGGKLSGATSAALASTERLLAVSNYGTEVMTVLGGGKVGIGTTTPNEKLTVTGDTIAVRHTTSNNIMASMGQRGSGVDGGYMALNLAGVNKVSIDSNGNSYFNGGNVGIGTASPYGTLQSAGDIIATGSSLSAGAGKPSAGIELYQDGTYGGTVNAFNWDANAAIQLSLRGSPIVFNTGAFGSAERMRIDSAGNVGIGTSTPNAPLTVAGASNCAVCETGIVSLIDSGDPKRKLYTGVDSSIGSNGIFYMQAVKSGTAYLPIAINPAGGNVGIGTTTPSSALAVSGGATIGADYNVAGPTNGLIVEGSVGIGTTSPYAKLAVNGSVALPAIANGAGTAYVCETLATGQLSTSTTACNPSSIRYKENVEDLGYGLSQVMAMRPVGYEYKPELKVSGHQVGFIAEEMENIVPEVVGHDADGLAANIDYAKLAPVIVNAIKEMQGVIDTQSAPTSTVSVMIDGVGNISMGYGTTTFSQYKLAVNGDVAATSFVNISTRDAKQDISYLDDAAKSAILDQITTLNVAQYHYKTENQADPLRLGLIAEEAPAQVLAVGGKGVDVYKLSTFTLAGVQAQEKKIKALAAAQDATQLTVSSTTKATADAQITIFDLVGLTKAQGDKIAEIEGRLDALAARVDSLGTTTDALSTKVSSLQAELASLRNLVSSQSAAVSTASTTSSADVSTSTIQSVLSSIAEWTVRKLSATIVIADRVEAKTVAVTQGFDITDQATGVVWCVTVKNGEWSKVPWACGTPAGAVAAAAGAVENTDPITQTSTANVVQQDIPAAPAPTDTTATTTIETTATTTTEIVPVVIPTATSTEPVVTATTTSATATSTPDTTVTQPEATSTPAVTVTVDTTASTATSTATTTTVQ
jgi:hypothetical protein